MATCESTGAVASSARITPFSKLRSGCGLGSNVRSSAEWTKKFNCGFEVQMEYSGFDSQSVKVRSRVVDLREINKGEGDLALLLRDGEYSLKKNDGRWSIQEYVAKLPVVSPNP